MVQWLRLHASTVGSVGSSSDWETKILHALRCGQKKKKVIYSKNKMQTQAQSICLFISHVGIIS